MNNFTLNLYKAFGIRKALDKPYIVSAGWGTDPKAFSNPYKAMAYAIKQQKQGVRASFIEHPNEGMSRLMTHPETGNFMLSHTRHGGEANDTFHTIMEQPKERGVHSEQKKQEAMIARDIHSFKNMQHFQNAAKATQLFPALGDKQMDISTMGLNNLPAELHTPHHPYGHLLSEDIMGYEVEK